LPLPSRLTSPLETKLAWNWSGPLEVPRRGEILESGVGNIAAPPYPGGPAVEGEVKVYFNNGTDGTLVAIYQGAGLSDPTGLCPGNSLNAGTFQFISNAPASEGAYDGFTTDVGSVRVCTSNVWLYNTMIPNDSAGTVYGLLEKLVDGTYLGASAVAMNSPGTPPIDYTISSMFTSDGATEITCAAALT